MVHHEKPRARLPLSQIPPSSAGVKNILMINLYRLAASEQITPRQIDNLSPDTAGGLTVQRLSRSI